LPEALGSSPRVAKREAPAPGRSSVVAVHKDGLPSISITLSPAQVDDVLRAAAQSRAPSVSALLGTSVAAARTNRRGHRESSDEDTGDGPSGMFPGDTADRRLSRSLLRGLSLLTCFDAEGEPQGIIGLAKALGMSPSTTHRYALTLVHLGLLEQSPQTRKYSLPRLAGNDTGA
jgi:hypothetical protein